MAVYIVTVFPLSRSGFKERLSYWSANPLTPGSIIFAPLRGRTIPALIESVESAREAKSEIKQADFMTRKIESADERQLVRRGAIIAAVKTAEYFVSPIGAVMKTLIPETILNAPQEWIKETLVKNDVSKEEKAKEKDSIPEILTFQSSDDDRYGTYRSIVREEFARKKSVIITVPTIAIADNLREMLHKGIDGYVIVLHSGLSKKKILSEWARAIGEKHTVLIITTPSSMAIPRADISTIIVEKESSRAYTPSHPPYIDMRSFAEYYARAIGARLIYGDVFLRVETLHRRETGEIHDFSPSSFRIEKLPESIVVDMSPPVKKKQHESSDEEARTIAEKSKKSNSERQSRADEDEEIKEKKKNPIMSEELESMIDYAAKKKQKIFIFCARRGLSPQTVCGDCMHSVLCDDCQAPVVLHMAKSDGSRSFLCHHCGKRRSALEACATCGSWKLITLGIAIDTIQEEIKKRFPDRPIFKIDRDTVTTEKQIKSVLKQFDSTPQAILLGTETALAHLPPIAYVAVASLDSLFSLPDFRINERITHIMLKLMSLTEKYFLIQTRHADSPLLNDILRGSLADIYRREINLRQQLLYPPFSIFIKVTAEGTRQAISEQMERVQGLLEPWPTSVFPAFIPSIKGKSILHLLLTLPLDSWPSPALAATLASLSPEFMVKVNPESLL
jgi:primosomal protein N'